MDILQHKSILFLPQRKEKGNDKAEQVENLQREERTSVILIPLFCRPRLSSEKQPNVILFTVIPWGTDECHMYHCTSPLLSSTSVHRGTGECHTSLFTVMLSTLVVHLSPVYSGTEEHPNDLHYWVSIASLHSGPISRAMVGRSNFNIPGNFNRRASLEQYGLLRAWIKYNIAAQSQGLGKNQG